MKRLLTIFSIILLISCKAGKNNDINKTIAELDNNRNKLNQSSDVTEKGLLGKVKSIRTKMYAASKIGDSIKLIKETGFSIHNNLLYFDRKGNTIEEYTYKVDSVLKQKSVYYYDSNYVKTSIQFYDINDSLVSKNTFIYDDNLNCIAVNSFSIDTSSYCNTQNKFDENNNKVYSRNESINFTIENYYKYDKNNLLLEERYVSGDIVILYKYEYDKKGHQICKKMLSEKGFLINQYNYEYDRNGNNIITEYYDLGKFKWKTEYLYDKRDNAVSFKQIDNKGETKSNIKYKYTYDHQGNWIQKEIYTDDIIESVIIRYIEYW